MRLSYCSTSNVESLRRAACAVHDPDSALEAVERHDPSGWPLAAAFRYRAIRLRRARTIRLCDWCLTDNRRCHDSRRPRTDKCWKAYRRHQWWGGPSHETKAPCFARVGHDSTLSTLKRVQ